MRAAPRAPCVRWPTSRGGTGHDQGDDQDGDRDRRQGGVHDRPDGGPERLLASEHGRGQRRGRDHPAPHSSLPPRRQASRGGCRQGDPRAISPSPARSRDEVREPGAGELEEGRKKSDRRPGSAGRARAAPVRRAAADAGDARHADLPRAGADGDRYRRPSTRPGQDGGGFRHHEDGSVPGDRTERRVRGVTLSTPRNVSPWSHEHHRQRPLPVHI